MKTDRFYFNSATGQYLPSGTTVLPRPDLMQWAADCAVGHIAGIDLDDFVYDATSYIDDDAYRKQCDKARFAYLRLSTEAADYGTYIHTLCQHSLENDIRVESPHKLTQGFMDGLWAWKLKHKVKVIAMEQEVLSKWYGGRLDLVCEMDSYWMTKAWCKGFGVEYYDGIKKQRVIVLVDFKTGKGSYYDTWKYQISGYRQAYNEQIKRGAHVHAQQNALMAGHIYSDYIEKFAIAHHGVLKFNKDTGKVNFKDFTIYEATRTIKDGKMVDGKLPTEKYIRDYETDRATFNSLVANWWLTRRGIQI